MTLVENLDHEVVLDELDRAIAGEYLPTYIYSYPPKRAYRRFEGGLDVGAIWADELEPNINIYLHIPFCRYRCTFCTLFLTTRHDEALRARYVDAVIRQIRRDSVGGGDRFVRSIYFGGGTPASLTTGQLDAILQALRDVFPSITADTEISLEATPDALLGHDLRELRQIGFNRLSIGLQTLDEEALRRCGRPYDVGIVQPVVDAVHAADIPHLNLDVIYGLEGDDADSWEGSLTKVARLGAQTISAYPVVVRPESTLNRLQASGRSAKSSEQRLYKLYDRATTHFDALGYRQESFTRFTRAASGYLQEVSDFSGAPLIGFGAGARSYTSAHHYSTDYAVGRQDAGEIISGYIEHQFADSLERATHGIVLDAEEQRRRFIMLNLTLGFVDGAHYETKFNHRVELDFSREIEVLTRRGLATWSDAGLRLTREGFKFSSAVGKLFYTGRVARLEQSWEGR